MAQKKQAMQKLKGLKLGPPSDKVKKMRQAPVYTSESHPIYVDWLVKGFDLKNRKVIKLKVESTDDEKGGDDKNKVMRVDFDLGMTICPGKHQDFAATGCIWERDLKMDLEILKDKYKIDVIVSLLSEKDLKS